MQGSVRWARAQDWHAWVSACCGANGSGRELPRDPLQFAKKVPRRRGLTLAPHPPHPCAGSILNLPNVIGQ